MSAAELRFYFDFSCPYAYIASTLVEDLAARAGARLDPRPMLLGGVFRARSTPQNLSEVLSPAKTRHNLADMHRQAARAGVELRMHPKHPMRTVEALRALLVVGPPFMPLAHAFYRAYWVEGIDLTSETGLRHVLTTSGHDADAILAKISDPAVKRELRERTDEAIALGMFGAPSCVIETPSGPEMIWGADRLDRVERLLCEHNDRPFSPAPSPAREELRAPVDVYFDYSSPFAHLGVHRAEQLFGDRARWHPMLLGAVFKAVGMANVPLFTHSEAKRQHTSRDLEHQAAEIGAPYRFPSRFPMRSVLALRVTLAAQAHRSRESRRLVHALFRAYWAEDRDIADPGEVARICDAQGFDGEALVRAAGEQPAKDALFASTKGAIEAGVFGAPSFVVHTPAGSELFWGADRIEYAARAAG